MNFDLAIIGGRVLDGTGAPWYYADLGIKGSRIVAVAKTHPGQPSPLAGRAAAVLDVAGQIVAPGFIDMHSHSDFTLVSNPTSDSKVMQGVTTELVGHCGFSCYPLSEPAVGRLKAVLAEDLGTPADWRGYDEYTDRILATGTSVNVAGVVGHATVRMAVMGHSSARPSSEELAAMQALVDDAMRAGAFGLSTGLIYTPGSYAATPEVAALASIVARHGGAYYTHLRSESAGLMSATAEAISIGRIAGLPVQISHIKCAGAARGRSRELIAHLNHAREEGVEVTADQYPYLAGATNLAAMLPPWVHVGGHDEIHARLTDPATRARIHQDMQGTLPGWDNDFGSVTFNDVLISSCLDHSLEGKTLQQIADERRQDPYELVFDLLADTDIGTGMVIFMMNDDDVEYMLGQEIVMIGSDAIGLAPRTGGKPHPRTYGTFARVLGEYVRERQVISLAQAVHKMTGFPAAKLGLQDRGLLREGLNADIVVFDPTTVADRATFQAPHQFPIGIPHVLVNGQFVVRDGEHTGARPGQLLRKQ